MSMVLFGALGFAGRSWEGGEAKAEQVVRHAPLRGLPARAARVDASAADAQDRRVPAGLRAATRDELRYAAPLPSRISGGGIWYYRLAVRKEDERSRLVLERTIPDVDAPSLPEFNEPDRSILAEDIAELRISYFGRDAGSSTLMVPTWRERWDDANRLPLMLRIEVVPVRGAPWPPLLVAPRQAPESGCRQWDAGGERCAGMG